MKTKHLVLSLTIAFLMSSGSLLAQTGASSQKPATQSSGGVATDYKSIRKRALPPFKPQQPKRIKLANGMVIFLQEDHELPFIEGIARIRGGGVEVPAAKAGLIGIYRTSWRAGGTKSKSGDELDQFLEARAADVETGGSSDSTNISFNALKTDFEDVFGVFNDLLREPEFREDKVDLAKRQTKSGISRRNDDANGIAGREITKLAYGADNPYVRQAEYWTIDAVTRQDLVDWHKKYTYPNNIILGVLGDFDSTVMEARLRRAFESWPSGPNAQKPSVQFKDPTPGVYFIAKDDVNQSNIELATLGIQRNNPDYFAIQVMNELFGGGFSSRLFSNVRSKKGLAYAVGGGIGANYEYPGLFRIVLGTKSETTAKGIEALYDELDNLTKNPGSAEEVTKAKENILNSFIFNFDSKDKVLREQMTYEFFGYPSDYLDKFQTEIQKVTPTDIARVVKKYVDRKKFAILVVGKAADFDKPLSTFGKVENIDITIHSEMPKPGVTAIGAVGGPTESDADGKMLIARVVQAMGGTEKLAGVKSIATKVNQTITTPNGPLPIAASNTMLYPNSVHSIMETPMGEMTSVVTPDVAYRSMGGNTMNLPASMKDDQLRELKRDMIWIAQHASSPGYFFAGGADGGTTILDINADGVVLTWYVEENGRVSKAKFRTNDPRGGGMVNRETELTDYRTVDGITLPFKRVTRDNGEIVAETSVEEVKFNPTVDPKLFAKPPQ